MDEATANSWWFGLRFKRACPFTVGDGVCSGVVDDHGKQVRFAGSAFVEKTEATMERGQVRSRAIVKVTSSTGF